MIVRIATEGQYELSESDTDELNELDNQAVAACDQQDDAQFHAAFGALLDFIRSHGTPVPEEHPEETQFAIDGQPDTGWTTEIYRTTPVIQDAAGKPGVGLIVDARKPVTARAITIRSAAGGWDAHVYGASGAPPQTLQEWGSEIGSQDDMGTDQRIELNATKARYFLIWITKLSPTPVEGGYQVEIDEVTLNS